AGFDARDIDRLERVARNSMVRPPLLGNFARLGHRAIRRDLDGDRDPLDFLFRCSMVDTIHGSRLAIALCKSGAEPAGDLRAPIGADDVSCGGTRMVSSQHQRRSTLAECIWRKRLRKQLLSDVSELEPD